MLESVRNVVDMVVSTMTTSHTLAMLLMTCIAIYWFTHNNNNNNNNKMKLPPGPPGYPIIGNLLDFRGTSLARKSLEWKEKYGPVIRFGFGPRKWVILTSVETVTEAFVQRGADFANRPSDMPSMNHFSGNGQDIAMSQFTPNFQFRRKVAMQAMRQYMTGNQHTKRIHDAVTQCVDGMLTHKGAFDPHVYLANVSFNIMHAICCGYTRKPDDPIFVQLTRAVDATISDLFGYLEDLVPLLIYCPTRKYRQFVKDLDVFKGYINDHIKERREIFDENNVETLIDNIILAQKQVGEDDARTEINDGTAMYLVLDVFTGGNETTKNTLDYAIVLLATHPDLQQKCHDEIDSILSDGDITRERRREFIYTEAVLLEVLRLYPAVYTCLPHLTARDTQVAGYDIPANTIVVNNMMAIHRDPRHWEKPDSFMPERFIEDDGKTLKPRPKSWMPFSVGPRNCMGEFMGRKNLIYSLVGLLQKLQFNMAPGYETPDLNPYDKWTFCVCKPYKVVVSKRHV